MLCAWRPTVACRPFSDPLQAAAGIALLHGNLAPRGAIIKPSAASPHLMRHRGRAVVFESREDLYACARSPLLVACRAESAAGAGALTRPIWRWTRRRCWC
jgi:dihydroxyacid dehydratase/phosphogluconate dehydratase